jgi:hypothetical protein
LSFDALRVSLARIDGYILVLDTKGVNVWCAAGKGTFGTNELIHRIQACGLSEVVDHSRLILPQLGAAGVAAHEVKKACGFIVDYGPVRAADVEAFLQHRRASPEMRRVRFRLADRLPLIPIEIIHVIPPTLVAAAGLYFLGGLLSSLALIASVLSGSLLFPLLLPWIPTANFSTKGLILGSLVALPFALAASVQNESVLHQVFIALSYFLPMAALTAFLGLNFTGASTFTSRSGVKREIYTYIPIIAGAFLAGVLFLIAYIVMRVLGV